MTGFYTDAVQDAILDQMFGSDTPAAPPVTFYVALFTTTPADDGSGAVEAAYDGYNRFPVGNDLTEFPAASAGAKSNANEWDFGSAVDGPTVILSFGFYSGPSTTDPADLTAVVLVTGGSVTINPGADVKFAAGAVDLTRCA